MDNGVNPYARGATGASGELTKLYGAQKVFINVDPDETARIRDQQDVHCRWVKNDSGGALLPGQSVKFKAGGYGTVIGGVTGAGDKSDGFVDEFLPAAGVADGKSFWIVERGPCQMLSTGGGALAQGDVLVTGASGEVAKQTAAPADETAAMVQVNSRVGVCTETVAATAHLGFIGVAKLL